jgi:hypothetical protein
MNFGGGFFIPWPGIIAVVICGLIFMAVIIFGSGRR